MQYEKSLTFQQLLPDDVCTFCHSVAPSQSYVLFLWPLPQSNENLTLTWKVDEDIYQHVDVKEEDKPNEFSLGRTLMIGNEVSTLLLSFAPGWMVG